MQLDPEQFADTVVAAIATATAPLLARIASLEQRVAGVRDGQDGQVGPAGKDADAELVTRTVTDRIAVIVAAEIDRAVAQIPPARDGAPGPTGDRGQDGEKGLDGAAGRDGRDAEPVDIEAIVQRVAVLVPAGTDGDRGIDGPPGRDGVDGKDAAPITHEALIEAVMSLPDVLQAAVAKHIEANPPPACRDGIDGLHGKDGADGIHGVDGNDGVGLAGAVLARDGSLVVTLSDGATKELGVIVGADGAPGPAGRDGINGIDGVHGKDGTDGKDGMGFDDMVVEHDGDRGIVVKLIQGDRIKTFGPFVFPVLVYKGVWKTGEIYQQGETVTWGGSMWHANKSTSAKPGDGGGDWTLSVKKGSDGSGGKSGPQGERGPRGEPGPMGPARYS